MKEQCLCQLFYLGETAPLALTWKSQNSIPFCMYLMPFKMLSQNWSSERVSPTLSAHGPLKRKVGYSLSPFSHPATVFCSQNLWRLVFLALETWAGSLVWDVDPSLPGGTSTAEIILPILHTQVWDQSILCLHASYQSQWPSLCVPICRTSV